MRMMREENDVRWATWVLIVGAAAAAGLVAIFLFGLLTAQPAWSHDHPHLHGHPHDHDNNCFDDINNNHCVIPYNKNACRCVLLDGLDNQRATIPWHSGSTISCPANPPGEWKWVDQCNRPSRVAPPPPVTPPPTPTYTYFNLVEEGENVLEQGQYSLITNGAKLTAWVDVVAGLNFIGLHKTDATGLDVIDDGNDNILQVAECEILVDRTATFTWPQGSFSFEIGESWPNMTGVRCNLEGSIAASTQSDHEIQDGDVEVEIDPND